MSPHQQIVLSASRRTDIPSFYMDWFMDQIHKGFFILKNPFTKKTRQIQTTPDRVHAIVFWSKNFDQFVTSSAGENLTSLGYNLYFNFTLNSESPLLEPHMPPLAQRLEQLKALTDTFGPDAIAWRFDPVCFYQTETGGPVQSNLTHFSLIAQKAADLGITKCVTSFFDNYVKIDRRIKRLFEKRNKFLKFIDPPKEKKTSLIQKMAENLRSLGISLHLCCEEEIFKALPPACPVEQNACIDGRRLHRLYKGTCTVARDYGQRAQKGCHCTKSVDIGSYDDHPCRNNCLFCYARPQADIPEKQTTLKET